MPNALYKDLFTCGISKLQFKKLDIIGNIR